MLLCFLEIYSECQESCMVLAREMAEPKSMAYSNLVLPPHLGPEIRRLVSAFVLFLHCFLSGFLGMPRKILFLLPRVDSECCPSKFPFPSSLPPHPFLRRL